MKTTTLCLLALSTLLFSCMKEEVDEPAPAPIVVPPYYPVRVDGIEAPSQETRVYVNGVRFYPYDSLTTYFKAAPSLTTNDTLLVRLRLSDPLSMDTAAIDVRWARVTTTLGDTTLFATDTTWTEFQWVAVDPE